MRSHILVPRRLLFVGVVMAALLVSLPVRAQQPPPDAAWQCNATLADPQVKTIEGLGAAQGVSLHDGKIYLYGDLYDANPRVGVIREFDQQFKPTGKVIWLKENDTPLLIHPTGLTWDPYWGCFLGDTVNKRAKIYHLDWDAALKDGNLDHAVLETIDDDAAINGCRPEFVTLGQKVYLATADYGDVHPEIRLCDPELMLQARRTSAPGAVVFHILCGSFNQNLHWDETTRELTCEQNVIAGRGWQLDVLNLDHAVVDGRADGPQVRVQKITLPPHTELEGYTPLDAKRVIFITSSPTENMAIGEIQAITPRDSPAGQYSPQ
jgi:hypothetical protein